MIMTSANFFKSLDEIITDKIFITDNLDELSKEIENNHWSFGIDFDTAKNVKNEDLKLFIDKIIENRVLQLKNSEVNVDLIFYSWFDEQAGNLNFNFINAGHEVLPFGAELELVDSIDIIINDFLSSKYLEGIPWGEFEDVTVDSGDIKEPVFKLKVYKEIISKI